MILGNDQYDKPQILRPFSRTRPDVLFEHGVYMYETSFMAYDKGRFKRPDVNTRRNVRQVPRVV